MALTAGTKLGPYEILAPLGAGGMGEVYHAKDTRLQREVAIKVLPEHLATSAEARQRLEREARSISRLSHPHICTLYDVGREDDHFFLVIEYLQGETLAERLKKGPLPLPKLLEISMQIADALDQAHRQGLIHRDLKPANIMLTRSGAKLLDFGLAKAAGETPAGGTGDTPEAPLPDLTATPTRTSPLTVAGSIVGTFQYMAPEILEGRPADARSDIFAFGTVLYEMATGAKAFAAESQAALIAAIMERDPPSVVAAQPMLPPTLDRLVQTCLAKDPDDRRQSMHDVLLDLRWIKDAGSQAGVPAPVTRRRRRYATLGWTAAASFALASAALARAG
ncbi:MAG: serine/threonine-protein kinase [Acidobacteria bacterium]|nr:serine/threonine-protein kinase [Acidobacteriota bacterium]